MVEVVDVPDLRAGEELQTLLHFRDGPVEREDDLAVVGDDRDQQVRDVRVGREFDALGVDHDQLELLGRARHQQAADERVETHRLALAGRTGDEHVRHRREVGHEFLAVRALAEQERQFGLRVSPGVGFENLAEGDAGGLHVRHLDADRLFSGNRGLDTEGLRVERALEVVLETGHRRVACAGGEHDRVLGHDRTLHRVAHRCVHAEELQRVDETLARRADIAVVGRRGLARCEQGDGRQDVRALVGDGLGDGGRRGRGLGLRGRCRDHRCGGRLGGRRGTEAGRFLLLTETFLGVLALLADAFLLGFALLTRAFLLGPRLLLLDPRLFAGRFLRPQRGQVGLLLLVVVVVSRLGLAYAVHGLHGRPAVEGDEEGHEVLKADCCDQRNRHHDADDDRGAEVGQELAEQPRHEEIAQHAARVGEVQVILVEEDLETGRVLLQHLDEAGGAEQEQEEPEPLAVRTDSTARDQQDAGEQADDRHDPDRQAEEEVAVVREPVAQRADPVAARHRRRGEAGDRRTPVVGQQGDEREKGGREEQPAEEDFLGRLTGRTVVGIAIVVGHFVGVVCKAF